MTAARGACRYLPPYPTFLFNTTLPSVVAYAAIAQTGDGTIVGGTVYMCAPFWTFPLDTPECPGGNGQADVLVHEVSHLFGKLDTAYGVDPALALGHDQAMQNADNFRYYARSE